MALEQHIDHGPPPSEESRPHDSITRRLIYALALLPIVPSVSIVSVACAGPNLVVPFDEFRLFHLVFSVLFVAATTVIWRSVIIWTLGRKWLTALARMIHDLRLLFDLLVS